MAYAFGREFRHLGEETIVELQALETEGAVYEYLFLDSADDEPSYVRIRLRPPEIVRYVAGAWGHEQFLTAIEQGASPEDALDQMDDATVAFDVRQYNLWAESMAVDTQYCLAAFLGEHLEQLICTALPGRYEIVHKTYDHDRRHLVREIVASLPDAVAYLGRSAKSGLHDIELKNEEEVRDLLFTMLCGVFPDARVEDPTEKDAGGSKRIDIVVPGVKTLLELKFVRRNNVSKISDQLKIDIESYHSHSAGNSLLCVLWDPERLITDRQSVIRDLTGRRTRDDHSYSVEVSLLP